jgi:hypothetical protein
VIQIFVTLLFNLRDVEVQKSEDSRKRQFRLCGLSGVKEEQEAVHHEDY